MNISDNNSPALPYSRQQTAEGSADFNELVLSYIKEKQPAGSLNDLLHDMKALSPDTPRTIDQLATALQYSDTILRNDKDYADYTGSVLDKQTSQLLGVKTFMKSMTDNIENLYQRNEDMF